MATYASYAVYRDPTSTVGRRVVAYIIDTIIVATIVLGVLWPSISKSMVDVPLAEYRCRQSTLDAPPNAEVPRRTLSEQLCFEHGTTVTYLPQADQDDLTLRFYVGWFAVMALNAGLLQGVVGGSIGKLVLGIRVVRADGELAGIPRNLLRLVLLFLEGVMCFLIGLVLALATKGHRRLGDFAASTYVVRKDDVGRPPLLDAPPWTGEEAPPYPGPTDPTTGAPTWGAPQAPQAPPGGSGPMWDDARNTYIQYDEPREQWVQWDDAEQRWKPIDT